MKKVISITIGNVVFSIEEDAYEKLSNYLGALRRHFGDTAEGSEILEDIESGIAEKFQARDKKDAPISIEDVDRVVEAMGTVHDFENFDSKEAEKVRAAKRLYRDPDDRMIAGVASGVAAFFGIDPVIVRIVFVVLAFANGLGILAYAILWLVMPNAATTAQKLEMHGEAVTVQKISAFVEENFEKIKKKDNTKEEKQEKVKVYGAMINFNKSLLSGIGSFIRIIIGIGFTLIGIGGIVGLTIGSFALLILLPTAPDTEPIIRIVVDSFFGANASPVLILSAYFLIFIPFLTLLLGGIGMLRKKPTLTAPLIVVMTIIWFFALMNLLVFGANNVPELQERIQALDATSEEMEIERELDEIDQLFDEIIIESEFINNSTTTIDQ